MVLSGSGGTAGFSSSPWAKRQAGNESRAKMARTVRLRLRRAQINRVGQEPFFEGPSILGKILAYNLEGSMSY
jgi:hypothetical protein